MKLLKGYYAYLAVSGGLLLGLAAQNNWALQMLAFALVSAGALSVQNASRWYMRASIAADVTMAFKLILGPAVIPPCLLRIVLQYAALVHMFAQASGLKAGELVHVIADAHIYDRHIPLVEKILANEPKKAPQLVLDPNVKDFYAFNKDSFTLPGYEYNEFADKIPVAI